jgi:hypothetical protein
VYKSFSVAERDDLDDEWERDQFHTPAVDSARLRAAIDDLGEDITDEPVGSIDFAALRRTLAQSSPSAA